MNTSEFRWIPVLGTVILATLLWCGTFYVSWGSFWVKISFSSALLAGVSLWLQSDPRPRFGFDRKALLIGLSLAVVLYLIFWAGKAISTHLFPFAGNQIEAIYGKGQGTRLWVVAVLLFFVTGPAEELYWRGFLQHKLMHRFGGWQGWLLSTALYAGVHLWALNFMLIGAAAVAGAFWGAMYWRLGKLAPIIISHSVWSTAIFALSPVP